MSDEAVWESPDHAWAARYRGLAEDGWRLADLAKLFGVSVDKVRRRADRLDVHIDFKAARDKAFREKFVELSGMGFRTRTEIAKRMGISVGTLNRRLERLPGDYLETVEEREVRECLDVWVERGERFTRFDFPAALDEWSVIHVLNQAERAGRITRFGSTRVASNQHIIWGSPDSRPRVSVTDFADDPSNDWLFGDVA